MLFKLSEFDRTTPEIVLRNNDSLLDYGFDGQILSIPGHSKGSIGILTSERDFICGDLFENKGKPRLNSIMDDLHEAQRSVASLRAMGIHRVFPGHGDPFGFDLYGKRN